LRKLPANEQAAARAALADVRYGAARRAALVAAHYA
jgi:hypothetical protein